MTSTATVAAQAPSTRSRVRVRTRVLGAVAASALVAVGVAMLAPSAHAATATNQGYAGTVALGRVAAGSQSTGFLSSMSAVAVPARTVTESAAYGSYGQSVAWTNSVWTYADKCNWALGSPSTCSNWTLVARSSGSVGIPASATAATLPSQQYNINGGGRFTVVTDLTWKLPSGASVGSKHVDYRSAADYACARTTTWNGQCYPVNNLWPGVVGGVILGQMY